MFRLIAANEYVPDHGIRHILDERHIVPLDIKTFKMLAKLVDSIIFQLRNLATDSSLNREADAMAIKLQAALFRFSFYRLAAGMDSWMLSHSMAIKSVKTRSFSI